GEASGREGGRANRSRLRADGGPDARLEPLEIQVRKRPDDVVARALEVFEVTIGAAGAVDVAADDAVDDDVDAPRARAVDFMEGDAGRLQHHAPRLASASVSAVCSCGSCTGLCSTGMPAARTRLRSSSSGADPVSMINRMTGSRLRSLVTKSQPVNPGSRRSLI